MTNRTLRIQKLTSAALLIALAVVIPIFFPKIWLPPASATLFSHVPIFIAMFISPLTAAAAALGSAAGFLIGTGNPMVVARAATHLIFAVLGSFWLMRHPSTVSKPLPTAAFAIVINLIHGACEVLVIIPFFVASPENFQGGFLVAVLLLVGVGTFVHSMVDFVASLLVFKVLVQQKSLRKMFSAAAPVQNRA